MGVSSNIVVEVGAGEKLARKTQADLSLFGYAIELEWLILAIALDA